VRAESLQTLAELAASDPRIVFLTADLGYGVVEPLFRSFPDRTFNVGVAEQNMIALATGLAEGGLVPYVYSIATFAVLRPFEFIRNGPVAHQLPVRILGVGGGMEYSNNGVTHLGLEDVGVLRTLPGMTIICPNDTPQAQAALTATKNLPGPVYYRLSKSHIEPLLGMPKGWDAAGAHVLDEGDGSIALVALGAAASELEPARQLLAKDGLDATTAAVSVIAPTPRTVLHRIAARHEVVATIESHTLNGGLGSLMCEVVAEEGMSTRVVRGAVDGLPRAEFGTSAYLARRAGVDGQSVGERLVGLLRRREPARSE
jgi:transketolase